MSRWVPAVTEDILMRLGMYNTETGIDYELSQLHSDAINEIQHLRIKYNYLESQCSYWREVALCSTAEVKSSTYDD
jgi:hypothetical protein